MRPANQPPQLTIVQTANGAVAGLLFDGEELPVPLLDHASIEMGRNQTTTVSISVPCAEIAVVSEADMRRQVIEAARGR